MKPEGRYLPGRRYYVFVGKAADGRVMDDAECRAVMELPVAEFARDGEVVGARDVANQKRRVDDLDGLVDTAALVRNAQDDAEFGLREEIAAKTAEYRRRIAALERELDRLGLEVSRLEKDQANAATSLKRLQRIRDDARLTATVTRQFVVTIYWGAQVFRFAFIVTHAARTSDWVLLPEISSGSGIKAKGI